MAPPRRFVKQGFLSNFPPLKTFKWDLVPRLDRQDRLTDPQRRILQVLQRTAGGGMRLTFIGRKKLSELTGFSESTCQRALKKFESFGLLQPTLKRR